MKTRLIFAALCILALPLFFSGRVTHSPTGTPPVNGIAYAGHTIGNGAWCECGTADCICDPGEVPPGGQTTGSYPTSDENSDYQVPAPDQLEPAPGALLFGLLFLLLWLKMR